MPRLTAVFALAMLLTACAADAEPDTEQAESASGEVARVILPIGIEAMCLRCHGEHDQISPAVRAVLEARYPADRASGYATGDLRGALWAEAPLR